MLHIIKKCVILRRNSMIDFLYKCQPMEMKNNIKKMLNFIKLCAYGK